MDLDSRYISRADREIQKKRKKRRRIISIVLMSILTISILIAVYFAIRYASDKTNLFQFNKTSTTAHTETESVLNSESVSEESESIIVIDDTTPDAIAVAKKQAAQYDYDAAIETLNQAINNSSDAKQITDLRDEIANYEDIKSNLVEQDIQTITHVFFHSLIVDNAKAFDGDYDELGYNQVMTTVGEFNLMLESLYNKGFVLVGMHDMAEINIGEDGQEVMTKKSIMLPEGKKALVMSQDDVCYYEYMEGDGFASRLIIGEDGRPTCEMDLDDGSSVVGSYDLVPILNDFIDKHPDFSYRGAKAIIAVTGYNGVFGYRTAPSYAENPTYEDDKEMARKVAQCLRDDGWELASHSWGHRHLGKISFEDFKSDCDKWNDQVESLLGDVDILLYPFGTDVADWRPYQMENERYAYLYNLGFRYFCNVDSSQYWVQLGDKFLRQGRRNLDGYRMWRDIHEPENAKLGDLFDANEVYDKTRPEKMQVITP